MNELTLELFQAVMGSDTLDEDGRQRVCAWLTALLHMPYLTDSEKKNAETLVEFLEGLSGGEVFTSLYQAVRTKLRLETPKTWDMEFPENYQVSIDGQRLTPDDLRARGIEHVDFRLNKPIRESVEYQTVRRLHADGTVEFLPEYQVFENPPVGERHVFNIYGEKAVAR